MKDIFIKALPSIITMINMSFGLLSIYFVIYDNYFLGSVMILFALVLDGLDGRAARKFNAESEFGAQLDSLSDLVSFGVAPAMLAYVKCLYFFGIWGLIFVFWYSMAGALRLARFNVHNTKGHFIGLPITAAGGFVALSLLLSPRFLSPIMILVIIFILSLLMISKINVPKY